MQNLPLSFVHLTDLHLKAPDAEDPTLLVDTDAPLERSLAEIARMDPPPAFIVVSGDLTNRGDVPAYATLAERMGALAAQVPVLYALGNHDSRAGFAEVFPELYADPSQPFDHDRVVAGVHVISLDSVIPSAIGGDLTAEQIAWLTARLAEYPELPKLINIHHSPQFDEQAGEESWEALTLSATRALRAALSGANVVGILCGHIHQDRLIHWHGIPIIVSSGHCTAADPISVPEAVTMRSGGESLTVCTLRSSGLSAVRVPHSEGRDTLKQFDSTALQEINRRAVAAAKAV